MSDLMTDTMSSTDHPPVETLRTDPDARLDYLLDAAVLTEHDDESLAPTPEFEDHRDIYVETYGDVDDELFHETVADLFGLSVEEAAARVEELDLTRWELATYLTVREHLDADFPPDVTLELASMVAAAGTATPIPPALRALTDDDYEAFLAENPDAVVFVLQLQCEPCRRLKSELENIRAAAPDEAVFAGLDGDSSTAFRKEFEVDVAPTTLVYADGEFVDKREGYAPPDAFEGWFADCYDDV